MSTGLIAVRDTVVAIVMAAPIVLVVGLYALANLAEPYPGVSPFTPVIAWQVPGDFVADPEARAVLDTVRASEGVGEQPVWLRDSSSGPWLLTVRGTDAVADVREALAATGVRTSQFQLSRGVNLAISDMLDSFVAQPAAALDTLRSVIPVLLLASGAAFMVAGLWFRRRRPVDDWEAAPAERPTRLRMIAAGVGVGLTALVVTFPVDMLTGWLLGVDTIEQSVILALSETDGIVFAAFFVLAVVLAPVGEELFFRGHLFRWSASRCGLAYAYVLTATLFALIHGNPQGIPVYATFALILGWAYERWRVVLVPIVAHATINGLSIALLLVG